MNDSKWQIKIADVGYRRNLDIYIWRTVFHGGIKKIEVLFSDRIETYSDSEAIPDKPSLVMTPEGLQDLANALDKFGIKPQQGFLEGKIEAQGRHLEDMRKLVFKEE